MEDTVIGNPSCQDCVLHRTAQYVCLTGRGRIPTKIMIVGEAPGQREDDVGKPFQGKSGKLLDELLEKSGFHREKVYITNAVKCRPPENRTPKAKEIKACGKYLDQEIEEVQPKFILLLGATAVKAVLKKGKITEIRGKPVEWQGRKVLATFHPAAALREPRRLPAMQDDFKRFADLVNGKETKKPPLNLRILRSLEDLPEMIKFLRSQLASVFDIETTSLDRFTGQVNLLGLGHQRQQWIVPLCLEGSPFSHRDQVTILKAVAEALSKKIVIGQFAKFDNLFLHEKYGVRINLNFDTGLASHLLNENDLHDLKYLARTKLGGHSYDIDLDTKTGSGNQDDLFEYLGYDVYYTYGLYKLFREEMDEDESLGKLFDLMVMPAARVYETIEINGIYVDVPRMEAVGAELETQRKIVLKKLNRKAGREINWNSPKQINEVLFNDLRLEAVGETPNGDPSTAESNLLRMKDQHSIVADLLEYRGAEKLKSSFIDGWKNRMQADCWLYPRYKIHGTVTGRPSCEDPNLQQVPRVKKIRSLISAPPGWELFEIDYSQIELRVAAMLARERVMLNAFQTGKDLHRMTAARALGIPEEEVTDEQRKAAKAVNFGFIYGMGAPKYVTYAFDKYQQIVTESQAYEFREAFFDLYPDLVTWHNRQRRIVHALGQVRTLTGRIRHLPDIYSPDKGLVKQAERNAINSPVQGFAAELTLMSVVELSRELPAEHFKLAGTVHDATVGRVRTEFKHELLSRAAKIMVHPKLLDQLGIELTVPLEVEVKVGPWGVGQVLKFN